MIYVWTGTGKARLLHELVCRRFQKGGLPFQVCGLDQPPSAGEGDVVLAMGAQPLLRLQRSGIVPKQFKVGSDKVRERRWVGRRGASVLVTYDVGATVDDHAKGADVRWAAVLASRLAATGTMRPKVGAYEWRDDLTELVDAVHARHAETRRPVPVALDLEFEGHYPWYPERRIVSSQWSMWPGRALVLDHLTAHDGGLSDLQCRQVAWLLTTPMVRLWGANLKGDLQWIKVKWGIDCANFTFDLLIGASLLDENRRNSLEALTKEVVPSLGGYDAHFNATYDKAEMSRWVSEARDDFLTYGGGDADATLQVGSRLARRLAQDAALTRLYTTILHPALRAFEKIEGRGVLVDQAEYARLEREAKVEIRRLTKEAFTHVPVALKAKYADNLSFSRQALVQDLMFGSLGYRLKPQKLTAKAPCRREGRWEEPVAEFVARMEAEGRPWLKWINTSMDDHLSLFAADERAGPFLKAKKELQKIEKLRSTYIGKRDAAGEFVKGFLSHLRPDGRLHPTYMLFVGAMFEGEAVDGGTITGRLSAKNPAWQTLMKHGPWAKKLRRCFPAPPGMLCWSLDFSQGELRVAACLADEQAMIAAYRRGVDIHAMTGARVMRVGLDEFLRWKAEDHPKHALYEEGRQKAKSVNFGFLYGMSAAGFVRYAWKNYGVVFTQEEADRVRAEFFEAYAGLVAYHERQKRFAHEHGYVRSPLGRIRHLPHVHSRDRSTAAKAERQSVNSPVQSGLSDLCLWAAVEIEREFEQVSDRFHIVGNTHDSLNGYGSEGTIEGDLRRAAEIAGNLPIREVFGWDHQVGFPVDAEMGPNLGEMRKVALAA